MATITAAWDEDQTDVALSDESAVADAAEVFCDFDLDASGWDRIVVQIKVDLADTAVTGTIDVYVYNNPDSGTTDDTIAIWSQSFTPVQNATVYFSFVIQDIAYAHVVVDNESGATVDVYDVKYAGRKWASA
jgi:hypothetical protein